MTDDAFVVAARELPAPAPYPGKPEHHANRPDDRQKGVRGDLRLPRVRRQSAAATGAPSIFLCPRATMGAIPAIATEADVDDLATSIGTVLMAPQSVPQTAG